MPRYNFDYRKFYEEASAIKENARKARKAPKLGSKKISPVGSSYPVVNTTFTRTDRYGIRELEETVRVAPIARSIWQLQLVAFPYFNFNVVAPDSEKVDEDVRVKLEEVDRRISMAICCAQAMHDVITYGSAIFEVVWGEDEDGWVVPVILQRLPAASFATAPSFVTGNENYVTGHLLKGIVYDRQENRYRYFQTQDRTGKQVEIPAENIIHIKDARSSFVDGEPYVQGIVATISQLEFVRKRMMQTVSRVGAPPMLVKVGLPPEVTKRLEETGEGVTGALPGEGRTIGDAMFSQLWELGAAIAQEPSPDVATVVPNGIDIEWQRPSVPLNPTDIDQYLIREAVSHIFPRDVLEVLSNAISTSAAPLLDLLKIMVQGWQQICSIPFENKVWTKMLELNGYEGYRVEMEWASIIPEDPRVKVEQALTFFNAHIITLDEARNMLGLPPLDEEGKKQLFDEMLKYKVPQSMMQQGMGGMMGGLAGMMGGLGGGEGGGEEDTSPVSEEADSTSEDELDEGLDRLLEDIDNGVIDIGNGEK